METKEIEIWVMISDAGDYVMHAEESELGTKWEEDIGDVPVGSRVMKIVLKVEVPKPVEITAAIPAKHGKVEMTVQG